MKPIDIINEARHILKDLPSGTVAPRQSDAELLGYVNQGIREIATLLPMLFSTVGDLSCEAGAEQSATFIDASMVVDVLAIHNGSAITRFDRATMDLFRPNWRNDPPGPTQQWSPLEGDPLKFFVYPPAPEGQILDVRYVRIPAVVQLDEVIQDLPGNLLPAMADYVVYRSESKDDEHVLSQRAGSHYQAFLTKIGAKNAAAVSQ